MWGTELVPPAHAVAGARWHGAPISGLPETGNHMCAGRAGPTCVRLCPPHIGSFMLDRRRCLTLAAAALATAASRARAQPIIYPTRFVRVVVPFAPSGGADVVGRMLAAGLSEMWAQQVVIENKGGAGGNIAAEQVARSEPDGYTLFFASIGHAINRCLFPALAYDPVADFAPISLVCTYPNIMVVPMSSPAHSVAEFIGYAKAHRGVTFASSSSGTSVHLAGELFKRMAGIEMTHVPYRGAGPAINDLLPGRLTMMFNTAGSLMPQARSGMLRALAVTTITRSPFAPDLPTVAESGVPEFEVAGWNGLFLPARTRAEIVTKVRHDAIAAIAHPPVKQKLGEMGVDVVTSTPAELAAHLKS